MLTYPNIYDQTPVRQRDQAFDMGAVAVGATIFFGSEHSRRQIQEVSPKRSSTRTTSAWPRSVGHLRNPAFKTADKDYHKCLPT